jgi:hypothetical protein
MGDYSVSWAGRSAARWGHWGSSILVVCILAAIALGVQPPPAGTPMAMYLPLLLFAFVIMSWIYMRQHDRRLCELCMRAMPLDASLVASRFQRRFAVAHASASRKLVGFYLVLLIGSNFLLPFGLVGRIFWAVTQSSMIYLVLAYSSHRRFQPWCPRCTDGGGGGGEDEVDVPDPLPQGGQLTT